MMEKMWDLIKLHLWSEVVENIYKMVHRNFLPTKKKESVLVSRLGEELLILIKEL